ncbi:MAG: hypothetical protein WCY15_02555 [Phenylobacterium sp.]|jgi:hypothetical protein|uniref:hypothetical protein n=1 Tax=Phenylobacterium sp. TaxID=1871053 RepID=UPI002A362DBE|nr:hypothetical protein [Phenylobacterium sp.]MDX9996890.1 hypothetical protein [Phenylobacterium sp.]
MAELSIGQAAGAGLRLIRREPLAVLGWAGLFLVLTAAMLLMLGGLVAQTAALAGQAEPDPADLVGMQLQMMGLQPLFTLGGLAVQTVVMAAVFRAVLQPEERRFAYLRFSAQELWLGLVTLTISFGLGFAIALAVFPLAGMTAFMGFMLQQAMDAWGFVLVGGLAFVVLFVGVVWLMLRLSMAYPMSFAERTFRLFESWTLTRGHVAPLFLIFLLAMLLALAIQLLFLAIGVTAILASLGASWQAALASDPLLLFRSAGSLIAVFAVLYSLAAALTAAIVMAPLADAYRQLVAEPA